MFSRLTRNRQQYRHTRVTLVNHLQFVRLSTRMRHTHDKLTEFRLLQKFYPSYYLYVSAQKKSWQFYFCDRKVLSPNVWRIAHEWGTRYTHRQFFFSSLIFMLSMNALCCQPLWPFFVVSFSFWIRWFTTGFSQSKQTRSLSVNTRRVVFF